MKKKYISMGASPLSVDIQAEGILRSFDFYGGMKSPVVKMPFYSTSDETEQQILESHPSFNVSFKLSDESKAEVEKTEVKEIEVEETQSNEIALKTFKTFGEAKSWINEHHEIPFNKLTNSTLIQAEFEKLGYSLEIETQKK